jgi:RNA polymerase sigma-70 factor (ECF subfamily)
MSVEHQNISDNELVVGCISYDRRYQEILYRKYADEMYNVALIYCDTEDEACDVLQESFIKIFRKLDTYKFESSLGSWIRRIIINTALDHYRKRKRESENVQNYIQTQELDIDNIISEINAGDLLSLIKKLPQRASMILKLYAIEGYAHKEIADMLDISEGTSKSQLSRARMLLKNMLAELDGK